ncbi:centrosomal protein of 19 kDa-like [Ylistrum balloti]|uniref:centrosomal protein of 19 kDa-like n=1 Tax=Ylistrum balloti TaxID=509963 RepID=UPI002905BFC0|nr:centrosomal protein of 19 kDa-like [Ylistrum balloti]
MENGIDVKKCGIKFDPPCIIVSYEKDGKLRRRSMPLRNFTKNSSVDRAAEELLTNPRHKKFVHCLPKSQLERLITIISDKMKGMSLEASLARNAELDKLDPEEDLNKVDPETLTRKKAVMENTFEKNRIKPGDAGFEYDKEVSFDDAVESCDWDDNSEDESF